MAAKPNSTLGRSWPTAIPPPHLTPCCLVPMRLLRSPVVIGGAVPVAREQRKLAAILAADVVGYSRLMGRDGIATLQRAGHRFDQRLIASHLWANTILFIVE